MKNHNGTTLKNYWARLGLGIALAGALAGPTTALAARGSLTDTFASQNAAPSNPKKPSLAPSRPPNANASISRPTAPNAAQVTASCTLEISWSEKKGGNIVQKKFSKTFSQTTSNYNTAKSMAESESTMHYLTKRAVINASGGYGIKYGISCRRV